MNFDIDIAIVVGFLILNLVVGLGHGKKVKTIKDYALGGRNFSTAAMVATIVATWASGSMFFTTLTKIYSGGIEYFISLCGFVVSLFILAFVFIPRMQSFLGITSVAEALGNLYGKNVRIITAIAGAIGSSGKVAVQFSVFGNLISYFLNIPTTFAIIVAGLVTTIYSAFGGIRSVTFTDLLQFITFGFVIPLIGMLVWNGTYDSNFIWHEAFFESKFNLSKVLSLDNTNLWSILALFAYFATPSMKPYWFQRVSMGANIQQVKTAFIISGVVFFFIIVSMAWIPFLIHSTTPGLEPDQLLGFIVDTYTYPGLKGLVLIAVAAMVMSTADSNINASSVLCSNDICKPLGIGEGKELLLSRVFALLMGFAAVAFAFSTKDILSLILLANSFYMPIVTPILFLTILGFRTSTKSILIGIAAGVSTAIMWKISNIKITGGLHIVSLVINILFTVGSHYLLKQNGYWINNKSPKVKKAKTNRNIKFTYKNIVDHFIKHVPNNELAYFGFGVYCIIYTITSMYSIPHNVTDSNFMLAIFQLMLITGIAMASYPIWPISFNTSIKKQIVQVWWYLALFYMLVLISGLCLAVSQFNQLQFIIFTINVILVVLLASWQISFFMLLLGILIYLGIYKFYTHTTDLEFVLGAPQFILMYTLLLIAAIIALFFKPKQEYQEATEAQVGTLEEEVTHLETEITDLNETVEHYSERVADQSKEIERLGATAQRILNNVNHELRLPVGNVMNFAEMLNDGLDKFSEEQLKDLSDEVYKNSNRLSSMILNMLDLATLDAKKIELNKTMINFGELVRDRVLSCRKIYLEDKKVDFEMQIEENIFISVDPNYMRQTVDNLVINAINFSTEGVIRISVLRKGNVVEFMISDNGIGIPKEDLYDIFTPFKMGSNAESKAEGRGVGLALCKAAVEAHGGSISAESKGGVGAQFRFVL